MQIDNPLVQVEQTQALRAFNRFYTQRIGSRTMAPAPTETMVRKAIIGLCLLQH